MSTITAKTTSSAGVTCWSCGVAISGERFCPKCAHIQPLRGEDYFSFLGFPQKLAVDSAALESRFHQLSWKLHPDKNIEPVLVRTGITDHTQTEIKQVLKGNLQPADELAIGMQVASQRPAGPAGPGGGMMRR